MEKINAKTLLKKYADGICSDQEKHLFEQWYINLNRADHLQLTEDELEQVEQDLLNDLIYKIKPPQRINPWSPLFAAASIVLCLSIGGYFLWHKPTNSQNAQSKQRDLLPGGNKAILTLSNGNQIVLSAAKNGQLAVQGLVVINKKADGQLVYDAGSVGKETTNTVYNMVTTPKGGQYQITLPDGSKILLNAASSLKYPTVFTGSERIVELTGEAYFEVAHDRAKPFFVRSDGQTVKVLGTHFNINAYNDEPVMRTTLIEGSVKVSKGTVSAVLKPGQQSAITNKGNNSSLTVSDNAHTDQVLAWTNGKFSFYNSEIQTAMREIGRWYDVDIVYEGKVPNTVFIGEIYRNVNLSKVLEILRYSKVNFRIEGKKIIVTP